MILRQWFGIGLLVGFFCLGCLGGGVSTAYYSLQPVHDMIPLPNAQKIDQRVVIGLGPVELPDYLDRAAIVTRITANRLEINDNHRWAGSLQSEIMGALVVNLDRRLEAKEVVMFPWTSRIEPDFRLQVEIQNFEGNIDHRVTLRAVWSLTSVKSEQPIVRRVALIQEKTNGQNFEALAAAMGRALAKLSGEMAGTVEAVVP